MERSELERLLADGRSLASIARERGLDASTVGKMAKRYGLIPTGRDKYAPKPIDVDEMRRLIASEASVREMATHFGVSFTTMRKHLAKAGLRTRHAEGLREHRRSREDGSRLRTMTCRHHGPTLFQLEGRGSYRCLTCRSEAVARRRRKVKELLIAEAGGRCALCGYDRYPRALHFHHLDPSAKGFGVSQQGHTLGIATLREEAEKCVLLCANCHAEVEGGIVKVPNGPHETVGPG